MHQEFYLTLQIFHKISIAFKVKKSVSVDKDRLCPTEGIGVFLNFLSFVHFKIHIIHLDDFISMF